METITRILVHGYNQRTRERGHVDTFAGEAVPVGEHLGFIVTRDGEQFAVHVKPLNGKG
jgi:hypothetical protein